MRKINTRLFFIKYLLFNKQAGFSLLESLMAVVVVSILMAAILPMVVLTTASRVQARRVDLATQAARSYTDGVRSGVINISDAPTGVTPTGVFPFIGVASSRNQYFTDIPAPNSTATVSNLFKIPGVKIDTNGNGFSFNDPQDLVIQPMRSPSSTGSDSDLATQGFYMAVRVYRADAFQSDTAVKSGLTLKTGNNQTDCPNGSRIVTATTGSPECPLVVMKVDIYPTNSTLDQIKSRL